MADSTAIQVIHDTIIINREIIIDSTRVIHDTVVVNTVSDYDILNRVDSFYNSAFTILIVVISIIATIIGVIIPLVIQSYQRRRYNQDMKAIEKAQKDLKAEIDAAVKKLNTEFSKSMETTKIELTKEFSKQLEVKFKEADREIKRIRRKSASYMHHLQGKIQTNNKNYTAALYNYIRAIMFSISSESYINIGPNLVTIKNGISHLSNYDDLSQVEKKANTTIEIVISKVIKIDKTKWAKNIKNIITEIEELKKRSKPNDENENTPTPEE